MTPNPQLPALPEALQKSQSLESNLGTLARMPTTGIKTFGAEWAGRCAQSALDEIARLRAALAVLEQLAALQPTEQQHVATAACSST